MNLLSSLDVVRSRQIYGKKKMGEKNVITVKVAPGAGKSFTYFSWNKITMGKYLQHQRNKDISLFNISHMQPYVHGLFTFAQWHAKLLEDVQHLCVSLSLSLLFFSSFTFVNRYIHSTGKYTRWEYIHIC